MAYRRRRRSFRRRSYRGRRRGYRTRVPRQMRGVRRYRLTGQRF